MKGIETRQLKTRVKAFATACVMLFCMAANVAPVHAQPKMNAPTKVRMRVPFAFTVENRTLPPGNYTFERLLNGAEGIDILVIRCEDNRVYHSVVTKTVQDGNPQPRTKAVFKRYGDRYFLAQVWREGELTGLRLQTSAQEIGLQMDQSPDEFVLMAPERVPVASIVTPRR